MEIYDYYVLYASPFCSNYNLLVLFLIPLTYHWYSVGFHFQRGHVLLWFVFSFSILVILLQVTFLIIWAVERGKWSVEDAWWVEVFGFMR